MIAAKENDHKNVLAEKETKFQQDLEEKNSQIHNLEQQLDQSHKEIDELLKSNKIKNDKLEILNQESERQKESIDKKDARLRDSNIQILGFSAFQTQKIKEIQEKDREI